MSNNHGKQQELQSKILQIDFSNVKDKEEFFRHRELLATGMGFTTELVNDKLYLYNKGKEFGIYYVEEGK